MDSIVYDLNRHLTYRIARLQSHLSTQASEILKHHADISLSEWRILTILTNPAIEFQKDVLSAMGLDKGQVSRTLKRLKDKEYIEISHDARDQRKRLVTLTESGLALIERMAPIMLRRQAHLQSQFSEPELEKLFEFIEALESKTGPIKELEA
ncbi:MAG: MarR family winged helix-turn-helix transcriptional regulator [Candidatus Puniceispirillaceae bacterium]